LSYKHCMHIRMTEIALGLFFSGKFFETLFSLYSVFGYIVSSLEKQLKTSHRKLISLKNIYLINFWPPVG
jgi:hypothetical protein